MDSLVTRRTFTVAGALVLAGCVSPDPEPPSEGMEVHHVDVGQGDSTVVRTAEDEVVVVDTGDWPAAGEAVIGYLESLGVDRVDHLVATHPHADHIGGHAELIKHFETEREGVGSVYDPGVPHTSQTYMDYLDAVEAYGHDLLVVEEGDTVPTAGDVEPTVLNPPAGDSGEVFHYNSVTLHFDYQGSGFVVTGDAEEAAESRMVGEWGDALAADIYQVGHHGSSTSSTEPFLDAVDPSVTVISSGYENQFGHPDDEVLLRFDEFGVETYWTGVHDATVDTVTDDGISVDRGSAFSTDPLDILEATPDADDDLTVPAALDLADGTTRLLVDRVEAGFGVLVRESADGVTGQALVPAELLPAATDGTVLTMTVDNGTIRETGVDREATARRRERAVGRLDALSRPLNTTP